jgi:hypothetical protein
MTFVVDRGKLILCKHGLKRTRKQLLSTKSTVSWNRSCHLLLAESPTVVCCAAWEQELRFKPGEISVHN